MIDNMHYSEGQCGPTATSERVSTGQGAAG